jgi:hypothetical protein
MAKIDDNTIIRQSRNCAYQFIEERAVVVYPKQRQIHWLNETASCIWKYISKDRKVKNIVEHICQVYDVDENTARKDLVLFLEEASKLKIIEIL